MLANIFEQVQNEQTLLANIFRVANMLRIYLDRKLQYIKSEAEVIAVKIQDFKRIPTSYLSYHR